MAARVRRVVSEVPAWKKALKKWAYSKSYFCELGLMHDDCLYETPDVQEAIKRLPPAVYDARNFRISRAMLLSMRKEVLPKDEWTKMEEDVKYLTPLVEEVKKERLEREEWNRK